MTKSKIIAILAFTVLSGCLILKVADGKAVEVDGCLYEDVESTTVTVPSLEVEWFSHHGDFEFEVGSSRIIRFGLREDGVVVWRDVDPNKKAGI